jgi:hypothetical protein
VGLVQDGECHCNNYIIKPDALILLIKKQARSNPPNLHYTSDINVLRRGIRPSMKCLAVLEQC